MEKLHSVPLSAEPIFAPLWCQSTHKKCCIINILCGLFFNRLPSLRHFIDIIIIVNSHGGGTRKFSHTVSDSDKHTCTKDVQKRHTFLKRCVDRLGSSPPQALRRIGFLFFSPPHRRLFAKNLLGVTYKLKNQST